MLRSRAAGYLEGMQTTIARGKHLRETTLMADDFEVGDHVEWNSEAGRARGTITKVITSEITFKGYTVHASKEEPQYQIKSDKTDHIAMHKGAALTKVWNWRRHPHQQDRPQFIRKEDRPMHKNMREMEQYSDEQFVVKGVYKGEQSEAVLLFLKPGQEMPAHPHERFEVVLVPQKGVGTMTVDGAKEVRLIPETLYYEPAGRTIKIQNTGDSPLQVLITLIRVEPPGHQNGL